VRQRITLSDPRKVTFDFVLLERFAGVHGLHENEFQEEDSRVMCLWKILSIVCQKNLPPPTSENTREPYFQVRHIHSMLE
jgi:hypothetical protein